MGHGLRPVVYVVDDDPGIRAYLTTLLDRQGLLHSQARARVVDQNLQALGNMVAAQLLEGYSSEYRASGQGDPEVYLSNHLELELRAMGSKAYINPAAEAKDSRAVMNTSTLTTDPPGASPAVLITDMAECQYQAFDELPGSERERFAGSLVVAFNETSSTIDVFCVDLDGEKSEMVLTYPTS